MNERTKRISRLVSALITGGLVLATLIVLRSVPVKAWQTTGGQVPSPCDFTTGGGWIRIAEESDQKANFGLVGGCKNGGFFGHVNYVDHNNGLHVSSDSITGYVNPCPGCSPPEANNARDICGTADASIQGTPAGTFLFRVRTIDAEQQSSPPPKDKFGIELRTLDDTTTVYLVPTRCLASDSPTGDVTTCSSVNPGGGDIELHKPNPSTFTNIGASCPTDDGGLGY